MIISRTPFRISFFGGGTDYPAWYREHGGSVLATTINKYCYISCRTLPPFFDHKHRVVYSRIENVSSYEEILHPAVRETLRFLEVSTGLELHHDGDLPARSGMGSSSSFTVGLLNALYAHKGQMPGKHRLAMESIHIEQNMIRETVGSQDQICAAYGGLNHIVFNPDESIEVRPITISKEQVEELNAHLMLFYTGIKRIASDVARSYVEDIDCRREQLQAMSAMVDQGLEILIQCRPINEFGELLNEAWQHKRCLSEMVTNGDVDRWYAVARENGAIGGKLTGAGGGGFLLLFVPPEAQEQVRSALRELLHVPFDFENSGTQIIFYELEREDYSACEKERDIRCGVKRII